MDIYFTLPICGLANQIDSFLFFSGRRRQFLLAADGRMFVSEEVVWYIVRFSLSFARSSSISDR